MLVIVQPSTISQITARQIHTWLLNFAAWRLNLLKISLIGILEWERIIFSHDAPSFQRHEKWFGKANFQKTWTPDVARVVLRTWGTFLRWTGRENHCSNPPPGWLLASVRFAWPTPANHLRALTRAEYPACAGLACREIPAFWHRDYIDGSLVAHSGRCETDLCRSGSMSFIADRNQSYNEHQKAQKILLTCGFRVANLTPRQEQESHLVPQNCTPPQILPPKTPPQYEVIPIPLKLTDIRRPSDPPFQRLRRPVRGGTGHGARC